MLWDHTEVDFDVLLGKTISSINDMKPHNNVIIITCTDGTSYKMYHEQNCCENVYLEDVDGDPECLLNSPITMASCVSNRDDPPVDGCDESYTWTFYKLATVKGYVTLRWFGGSNGYYSEDVNFVEVD